VGGYEIFLQCRFGDSNSHFRFPPRPPPRPPPPQSFSILYSLLHPPHALRFASTPSLASVLAIFSTSFKRRYYNYNHYYLELQLQIQAPIKIQLEIATTTATPHRFLSASPPSPFVPASRVPSPAASAQRHLWYILLL
jgi:hypothetical protein